MRSVLVLTAIVSGAAAADDLSGADKLLCSTLQSTACLADGECESLPPAALNIPQFVEVDVKAKQIRTTPASGEDRKTPLQTVQRTQGEIVLQGYENGRAFSLVIQEATGHAAFASAADARGVLVFAACTPLR
jgi:hypothetical protein